MIVLVTLNSGQGVNLGPNFTLSVNTGTITPSTATLTQLLSGIYVTVDNAATNVTITSLGSCTNSLILNINSITTTTTAAPTTTTTAAPTTTTTATPTTTTTATPTTTTTTTTAAPTTTTTAAPTTTTTAAPTTTTTAAPTTTTTAAPTTTTTTTTAAPTTTTTAAPTTTTTRTPTTTTTTLAPLTYNISYSCSGTNAIVTINTFDGGSGGYSYGTALFNYESDAYANTSWTVGTSNTYAAQSFVTTGLLWSVIKDSLGNKLAKSVVPNCTTTTTTTQAPAYYRLYDCIAGTSTTWSIAYPQGTYNSADRVITNDSRTCIVDGSQLTNPGGTLYSLTATGVIGCPTTTTTTTTTLPPVNFSLSYVCDYGTNQITANGFTGGAGTYQISTQLYSSPAGAYGGTFVNIVSAKVYPSTVNGTYWVALRDAANNSNVLAKSISPDCCNPAATWTSQDYNTCGLAYNSTCNNYLVYRDTNSCSRTFNNYQVNGVNVGNTAPSNGNCNTTAAWTSQGYNTCGLPYDGTCNNYLVYRDTTTCSATFNNYQVNGVNVGNTAPSNGNCNTTPAWTSQGYNTCGYPYDGTCVNYLVYRDTTQCSATFNNYRVNGVNVGNTPPSNGNCNTTANWTSTGTNYYTCSVGIVNTYPVTYDTNPCSSTYHKYKANNVIYTDSPANSYPSTTATLSDTGGRLWSCSSNVVTSEVVNIDTNECSSTWNQYYLGSTYYGTSNPSNSESDVATSYAIYVCADGSTIYTQNYCIGAFSVNARVLANGSIIGYISATAIINAGAATISTLGGTGCPPVYTQFISPCDGLNYYIAGSYADNFYFTTDTGIVPNGCINWVGITSSPSGTEFNNIANGDCPGC